MGPPGAPWTPPGGIFFLNVKLEHMARLHKKELLAQNDLKAQEMKISLDSNSNKSRSAAQTETSGTNLM